MNDWQPIETAPKDYQWVLVWSERDGVMQCRWEDAQNGWPDGFYDMGTFLHAATHWQPLPPPPR